MKKVEAQLNKMLDNDVIEPVDTPTDWCSPIVVVPKPNVDVRLSVDLTRLNKNVKREIYAIPSDLSSSKPPMAVYFDETDR